MIISAALTTSSAPGSLAKNSLTEESSVLPARFSCIMRLPFLAANSTEVYAIRRSAAQFISSSQFW